MKRPKLTISLDRLASNSVEKAIEDVFAELNINDAYYANILNVTTHLFDLAQTYQKGDEVTLSINYDYRSIEIVVGGLKTKLLNDLQNRMILNSEQNFFSKNIFLIQSLVDRFSFGSNSYKYAFDVGALSPDVFKRREYALQKYFKSRKIIKATSLND